MRKDIKEYAKSAKNIQLLYDYLYFGDEEVYAE